MSILKIGILTFHRCINYGSYWQARCLAEGLQARGHQVEILDHYARRVNIAEWKCAFQPVLPTAVPQSDWALYREKIEKFFRIFETLPLSKPFPLQHPEQMDHYDIIVVGSDEVWNLNHPWYGGCPLFYGEGLRADRVVSYAASYGNYAAAWGLEKVWADRLQHFEAISVRDENTKLLVKNALGIDAPLVLDPCLQFPVVPDARNFDHLPEKYIAVYGHNFSDSYAQAIRQWAAYKNIPLISIGYRNDWAHAQWLTADPHDFAHFIARAEAVATNFFHGCVFALRNQKPFVCETSPYRSNKLQGLMAKLGGEGHLLPEGTPPAVYEARMEAPLPDELLQKIIRLRQSSDAYLDRALGLKKFEVA